MNFALIKPIIKMYRRLITLVIYMNLIYLFIYLFIDVFIHLFTYSFICLVPISLEYFYSLDLRLHVSNIYVFIYFN